MGLASPLSRPPSLARESLTPSKLILATPSMSQGFHQGSNIFSFSDEFHERPQHQQHHHLDQQSRRDKLIRPVQGFFEDCTAVEALSLGNPLQASMEEEEEEEEEEEVPGIYGAAPPTAGANNILPEMFNFPGAPADLLSCQNSPIAAGYHRFQQRPAPGFLGDSWPYAGSRQGLLMDNTSNWGSLEDAAAAAVGKQHGDMNPDSSTAMRLFSMNPQSSAASREPQEARRHHQYERHHRPAPNSPSEDEPDIGAAAAVAAAVAPLHHTQASHHSQAYLGDSGAAYVFGGGRGGSVMDTQGLSLSLSSSLRQFEIMSKADQELGSVREAASGTLFFDSQLHHHQQAEQHDHELLAAGHHLQFFRQNQQQQQQQQHMVMNYGGGCDGGGPVPRVTAGVMNELRNSKYSRAAQELLEEFCSVGRGGQFQLRSGNRTARASNSNPNTSSGHAGGGGASTSAAAPAVSTSSSKDVPPPLSPADRFENQRKKSKLLSILEELEKRYNHYCEQMQMVVNSFDSMMGLGAATPYTALAQKAMSRHFRCLKDVVAAQLRGACELLGEKDGAGGSSGLTKGETPRLRLIDQNLRQQRAFHQMGMMEQEAWRPQRGLPDRSVNVLRAWLFEHFLHPYPSDADKHLLARQTGLSRNQVSNWFINARVRLWKPMVEEMYQQEAKEEEEDDGEEEEDLQHNKLEEETANSRTLASVPMQQLSKTKQQQAHDDQKRQQSPESHAAPENDPSSAPIPRSQPRAQADDAAAPVIFSPALDDGMYGRAAAVLGPSSSAQLRFSSAAASARGSGDLSLTLGLLHAGGNAPESGRFGL